jgi:MFS family permease
MRAPLAVRTDGPPVNRWWQLVACIVAMMAISNLQYAWTLFTLPLTQRLHATLSAVQLAFTLFILAETWLVPVEGYLVDRLGAWRVVTAGRPDVAGDTHRGPPGQAEARPRRMAIAFPLRADQFIAPLCLVDTPQLSWREILGRPPCGSPM